jgi:hypothetical protein
VLIVRHAFPRRAEPVSVDELIVTPDLEAFANVDIVDSKRTPYRVLIILSFKGVLAECAVCVVYEEAEIFPHELDIRRCGIQHID